MALYDVIRKPLVILILSYDWTAGLGTILSSSLLRPRQYKGEESFDSDLIIGLTMEKQKPRNLTVLVSN